MRIDEALHFIHNQPNLGLAVQEEIFRLSASTCPTADARSETQVELSSQGGVFIIVGILILIAVTLEVGTALKNRKAVARAAQGGVGVEMEGEHAGDRERSDRELLLTVLQLLACQLVSSCSVSRPGALHGARLLGQRAKSRADVPSAGASSRGAETAGVAGRTEDLMFGSPPFLSDGVSTLAVVQASERGKASYDAS